MPNRKPANTTYHCRHCNRNHWRKRNAAWIEEYCEQAGKVVRWMRLVKKVQRSLSAQ